MEAFHSHIFANIWIQLRTFIDTACGLFTFSSAWEWHFLISYLPRIFRWSPFSATEGSLEFLIALTLERGSRNTKHVDAIFSNYDNRRLPNRSSEKKSETSKLFFTKQSGLQFTIMCQIVYLQEYCLSECSHESISRCQGKLCVFVGFSFNKLQRVQLARDHEYLLVWRSGISK